MAEMYRNLGYGLKSKIADAVAAGTLNPGTLIVTSDMHDMAFVNHDGTVEYLYQEALAKKAPINNPEFTGTVTLAQNPVEGMQAATKAYVDSLIVSSAAPGIVNSSNPLPTEGYTAGLMFRVAEAGTYAGQVCEVGDLIIVVKDYASESAGDADFIVLQANIDGAVTGAESSTDLNIAVFDGATGKVIKDSNVSISSVNDAIAKAHEHENKEVLDSFTKTQAQIETAIEGKVDKGTTLAEYGIEDAYTKTETDTAISGKISESETSTNAAIATAKSEAIVEAGTAADTKIGNKVGAIGSGTVKDYVDTAVSDAKTEVVTQAGEAADNKINAKVGAVGEGTVKDYVDTKSSDAQANAEKTSKEYVDNALKVIIF